MPIGIEIRQQILLRLDLAGLHLSQKFLLLERPLRDADAVEDALGPAVADERKLLDVLIGIDAGALQRGLELLDVVRHDAVAQRLRGRRIAQVAVIHRDDLLHRGRNYGLGVAAQGRGCGRQAQRAAHD